MLTVRAHAEALKRLSPFAEPSPFLVLCYATNSGAFVELVSTHRRPSPYHQPLTPRHASSTLSTLSTPLVTSTSTSTSAQGRTPRSDRDPNPRWPTLEVQIPPGAPRRLYLRMQVFAYSRSGRHQLIGVSGGILADLQPVRGHPLPLQLNTPDRKTGRGILWLEECKATVEAALPAAAPGAKAGDGAAMALLARRQSERLGQRAEESESEESEYSEYSESSEEELVPQAVRPRAARAAATVEEDEYSYESDEESLSSYASSERGADRGRRSKR